jgi:hypothetical protein
VAAGRDEARVVERPAELLRGDRAIGALGEIEELEDPVAVGREVLEDRGDAAGQGRQRAEIRRVLRDVAAAEVAADRAVLARGGVPERPLLDAEPLARDQAVAVVVVAVRFAAAERSRRPDAERGRAGDPRAVV